MIEKGIYRHFKGQFYAVDTIAKHSETDEFYVVYRALYGERGQWVRPLDMFDETIERDVTGKNPAGRLAARWI